MLDISIVILNYKMRSLIERCLETLFADIANTNLSIGVVVTDNDSGDGLLEWITEKYPQVKTIQNGGNVGFARGVNPGIKLQEARYYFILNPDTEFRGGRSIEKLYEWMEKNPRVGIGAPKLLNGDGTVQHSCHRFPTPSIQLLRRSPLASHRWFKPSVDHFLMKDVDLSVARPVDWVQGSALFIRREALNQVGLLDERFWMYFEDADWCRRFWVAGWSVYYIPEITLVHLHGRGSAKIPGILKPLLKNKLARQHLKSWAQYFLKWGFTRTNSVVNV